MGKIKLVQQTLQSVILKELSGKICAELFSMVGKAWAMRRTAAGFMFFIVMSILYYSRVYLYIPALLYIKSYSRAAVISTATNSMRNTINQ